MYAHDTIADLFFAEANFLQKSRPIVTKTIAVPINIPVKGIYPVIYPVPINIPVKGIYPVPINIPVKGIYPVIYLFILYTGNLTGIYNNAKLELISLKDKHKQRLIWIIILNLMNLYIIDAKSVNSISTNM